MGLLKRLAIIAPLVTLASIVVWSWAMAGDNDDQSVFSARFLGVNETPSVSTDATATLTVQINGSGDTATIHYTLTIFPGLRAPVTQAHIHFGQARVAAGIMVFLCGTATNPGPAGTPTCPQSGTVSRTVTAADVVGPSAQGIAAGEMGRVVDAIRAGAAYGNVHSTMFPAGETRGQLKSRDDEHDSH
jgi:hypothetical protein